MLLTLIASSALLFALVTWFCIKQGLFDSGSMGIGQAIAAGLYIIFWFGGTVFACCIAYLVRN